MRKMNGFTLVELIGVLVILILILLVAIPSISSSVERSKAKQNAAKEKMILTAAKLYIDDFKNKIDDDCYITTNDLINENIITMDDVLNSDGKVLARFIKYNKNSNTYEIVSGASGLNKCN